MRWGALLAAVLLVSPALAADGLEARARAGDAEAAYRLAANLERTTRDYARAMRLHCEAAARGHAGATFSIALLHLTGRGVPANDARAVAWMRLAAARGHEHARALLTHLPMAPLTETRCPREWSGLAFGGDARKLGLDDVESLVRRLAPSHRLDPDLVLAVVAVESSGRVDARSPMNAQGLMQLMPETAAELGVEDALDPVQNLQGGMRYLRRLIDRFQGDLTLALAAYNAGAEAVARYGGVPPYPETQAYVRKLRALYPRGWR
jgi:soluble lytic murein transglycosylase-like protein